MARLTMQDIRKTARRTAEALAVYNLKSCLFGSAACAMYGMDYRVPGDIDMIVLSDNLDTDEIKQMIVSADDRFYLEDSANPANTYKILHYALPGPARLTCKVDILVPGDLNIPNIPHRRIQYFPDPHTTAIPVIPFLALLILKLQGWTDHRDSPRRDFREKQHVDVDDIHELLAIAEEDGEELRNERWMPKRFVGQARSRVLEFVDQFPDTEDDWREIGFRF